MYYLYKHPGLLRTLSFDEQRELVLRAREGDHDAARQVVDSVMKVIILKARRLAEKVNLPYVEFADLVHEGVLACYDAIQRFDETKTTRGFWVYASWWADNYMNGFVSRFFRNPAVCPKDVEDEVLDTLDPSDDEGDREIRDRPRVSEYILEKISELTCEKSKLLIEYMYLSGRYRNGRVTARVFGCSFQAVYQRLQKIFAELRESMAELNPNEE